MTLAQRIIDEVCRYHGITVPELVSDHKRKYAPKTLTVGLMRMGNVPYEEMKLILALTWINSVTRLLLTHMKMMKEDATYRTVFDEIRITIYGSESETSSSTFDAHKPIIKSLKPISNGTISSVAVK